MSDTPPEVTPPAQPEQPAATAPAQEAVPQWADLFPEDDPAKVRRDLDHAREWEKRSKENAEAAKQWAAYQESQKTEAQRLADAKAATDAELAELRAKNARLLAAATHSIPADLIDLLGTGTEEEISARAQLLAQRLATPPPGAPAGPGAAAAVRPVESLTPGAQPATTEPLDPNAWLRQMAGRGG